jgi:hypothetical protein
VPQQYCKHVTGTQRINNLAAASRGFSVYLSANGAATLAAHFKALVSKLHALETPIEGGHRIGLSETVFPSDKEHAQAIAALSEKLGVQANDVAAVFRSELDRLTAGARITNFLIILALSKTRSILRARPGRATVH